MLNSLAKQGSSKSWPPPWSFPSWLGPMPQPTHDFPGCGRLCCPRWGSQAKGGHGVSTIAVMAAAGWWRVRERRSVSWALALYCRVIALPVLNQWFQPPQASHSTASPSLSPLGDGASLDVTDSASLPTCGACSQHVPSLSICSYSFSPRWRQFWWLTAIHCSACKTPTQAVIWVLSYAQLEPLGDDTLSN